MADMTIKSHEKKGRKRIKDEIRTRMEKRGLPPSMELFREACLARRPVTSLWKHYKFIDHPDTPEKVQHMSEVDYERTLERNLDWVERKVEKDPDLLREYAIEEARTSTGGAPPDAGTGATSTDGAEAGDQLSLID